MRATVADQCFSKCDFLTNNISITWAWLEMLILELDPNLLNQVGPQSTESPTLRVVPSSLCFNNPSRWFWSALKFEHLLPLRECMHMCVCKMVSTDSKLPCPLKTPHCPISGLLCAPVLHIIHLESYAFVETQAPMSRERNQGKFSAPYSPSLGRARHCLCIYLYTESILLH